jgi:hypothetical protein
MYNLSALFFLSPPSNSSETDYGEKRFRHILKFDFKISCESKTFKNSKLVQTVLDILYLDVLYLDVL